MRIVVLAIIAASLSACGFDSSPPPSAETPSKPVPAAQPAERQAERPSAEPADPIPQFVDELTKGGSGHFRFDRLRDVEAGGQQRQVFVEMIGRTDVESARKAHEVLESLGFKELRRNESAKSIRVAYADPDGNTVQVNVRSREAHSKLKRSDATSSVYLTQSIVE
jgi:hypothetical protein